MTKVKIDPILLESARRLSGYRDDEMLVGQALREFIQRLQKKEIMEYFSLPSVADGEDPDFWDPGADS